MEWSFFCFGARYLVQCEGWASGEATNANNSDGVFCFLFCVAGHSDSVASLAFSTDGQLLASGGLDGIVNVWDSSTGSLKQRLEGPGEAIEVSVAYIYTAA
jgi:WD40 repeat protein